MRLFTALNLPSDMTRSLIALIDELKPVARLRWSPLENLHITTKFIGDWPKERLPEVYQHLPDGCSQPDVAVHGVGFFPNERYPKVLFARVEPSAELLRLGQATDAALGELGIPLDKHPYRPHVTLARIPESVHLHPLRDRLTELKPGSFGSFRATEFSLFESRAGLYTRLASFGLMAAPR